MKHWNSVINFIFPGFKCYRPFRTEYNGIRQTHRWLTHQLWILIYWADPAWVGPAWHFHYFRKSRKILSTRNLKRYIFPLSVSILFYRNGWRLICDECVCIECVIRQMFSFPDHSGCLGSMALMFHSQWYLSLTSSQMPFHPRKWNASAPIFISTFFSGPRSYKLVT